MVSSVPNVTRSSHADSKGIILYCSFILFGLAQLLPWNVYMKSIPYIRMRLGDAPTAPLIAGFMPSAFTACNFLTTLFLVGLRWDELLMDAPMRTMIGMAGNAILMVVMVVIIVPDFESTLLFILVISVASLAGIVTSFLMKGLLGTVARFPSHLTPALVVGQALAGLFISVASVITTASSKASPTDATGPIAYFSAGAIVLSVSFAVYLLSYTKNKYFRSCLVSSLESSGTLPMTFAGVFSVFQRIKWLSFGLTVTLGTTVSLFTTFITAPRQYPTEDAIKYLFTPLSFVAYDFGDVIGRWAPAIRALAAHPRSKLMLTSPYLRLVVFVPLFIVLAPVSISGISRSLVTIVPFNHNDVIYYCLALLFGLSNGYLTTLLLMHAPTVAVVKRPLLIVDNAESKESADNMMDEGKEREMSGAILGLFLNIGLLVGSLSNFLWRVVL